MTTTPVLLLPVMPKPKPPLPPLELALRLLLVEKVGFVVLVAVVGALEDAGAAVTAEAVVVVVGPAFEIDDSFKSSIVSI